MCCGDASCSQVLWGVFNSPPGWAAGFHNGKQPYVETINAKNNDHIWTNVTNVLSWIPGLSIISGVYYLYKAHQVDKRIENSEISEDCDIYATALRGRAIASFLQASIFLAVLDIIATIGRFSKPPIPQENQR